jgi:hypothetical protein
MSKKQRSLVLFKIDQNSYTLDDYYMKKITKTLVCKRSTSKKALNNGSILRNNKKPRKKNPCDFWKPQGFWRNSQLDERHEENLGNN